MCVEFFQLNHLVAHYSGYQMVVWKTTCDLNSIFKDDFSKSDFNKFIYEQHQARLNKFLHFQTIYEMFGSMLNCKHLQLIIQTKKWLFQTKKKLGLEFDFLKRRFLLEQF